MKNKFLDPSVEVLKFNCTDAIEGSPDVESSINSSEAPKTEVELDDIFG